MDAPVVTVAGLGKSYRIGARQRGGAFSRGIGGGLRRILHGVVPTEMIWALRDVSFEVAAGEVLGVIGRNGAGKSTLLKLLSRITEPSCGSAEIRGRVGSLLEVGTGFHAELTGRENVYLSGAILGMRKSEIDACFDEIVAFSEIDRFIDTPVKRYSSGMYVRLAFAVAAHLEPEILLVDEVLAVGDAAFRRRCLGKMGDIARTGRTVLFVSHSMLAVQSLCSRALLLDSGTIVFNGSASEAVDRYLRAGTIDDAPDIGARNDRQGGDRFRFTGIELLDPVSGERRDVVMSGEPVLTRIHFENREAVDLDDISVGIAFTTPNGGHMFACRSRAVGAVLRAAPGRGATDCVLPRWPLKAGRYTFHLFAEVDERPLDWVQDAGAVTVEAGDYYGTGVIPGPGQPGVLVEYQWDGKGR